MKHDLQPDEQPRSPDPPRFPARPSRLPAGVSYDIYADRGLILMRTAGRPSPQTAMALLREVREDPRFRPGMSVLSDRRGLDEPPDAFFTGVILEHLASAWPREVVSRWAILTTPGVQFGMARMLALRAELRGLQVEAFSDEQEALDWLRDG